MKTDSELAGILAVDILRYGYHMPVLDGKANRELIEEAVTIGIMRGELGPLSEGTVNLAIETVEALLKEFNAK